MSPERSRRWTLIVVREGEVRSRTLELSRGRVVVLATVMVGLLAATFFFVGRWSENLTSRGRISELETEVSELRRENEVVAVVGERLERLEEEYRQLREVMGGEVAPSRRDILLPPLAQGETARIDAQEGAEEGAFVWPLVEASFVTRTFGDTTAAPFGGHVGVDIAIPAGSYVRSVRAGRVTEAGEDPQYGLYTRISHRDDMSTLYAHNSWLFVAPGDSVDTGEVIALSGNSGRSTAPHLHIEVENQGLPVDPLGYLADGS
jgi:murein DD-endopeptidase MepM/ murein hydrolase activator NlpD